MQLSKLVDGYFLDKSLVLSHNSVNTYGFTFNSFINFVGDIDISEVTATTVKRYLQQIVTVDGVSKRTAFDRHAHLSSLYKWANEELDIDNIMLKVAKPKYTKRIVDPFTPTELETLIKNLEKTNYRFNAIFLTLLDSGLRISELTALKIADYNDTTGKLYIRSGKGDKDRIVYLGKKARKAIWRYLADRKEIQSNQPLFATSTLTAMNRHNVRRDLQAYGKALGINAHPHKCRHTFAVNFLRNGGNIRQLQMILGHARLDMIQTYTKLAEIDLQQATDFSPVDNI